ncbi:right-handed parallel beta-helix repeat-containing protein [Rhodocyclaceae bacterium SMB388]
MKGATWVSQAFIPGNRAMRTAAIRRALRLTLLLTLALASVATHAQRTLVVTPDTYRQALPSLQAGDMLILAPGEYTRGLPLRNLAGTAEAPITITGPDSGPPAVLFGRDGQITVSLINVSHIILQHLRLEGRGTRSHGIVAEGRGSYAHHVTLQNLVITGFDAAQAFNGISTKTTAWGWVIRDNHISHNGTGLYLGNSDGRAPFVAGRIEHNHIEHTTGYNMQIKHQLPRPDLPGMPTDPSQTIIRHNVFDKSAGGATAERARPNLLLGHWPLQGPGTEDLYLVEHNLFYQNPTERLFQAEGHVTARYNEFINLYGEAVSFQPHNHLPRAIDFSHNTVAGRGPAVRITGADPAYRQGGEQNRIFSESAPIGLPETSNAVHPLSSFPRSTSEPD